METTETESSIAPVLGPLLAANEEQDPAKQNDEELIIDTDVNMEDVSAQTNPIEDDLKMEETSASVTNIAKHDADVASITSTAEIDDKPEIVSHVSDIINCINENEPDTNITEVEDNVITDASDENLKGKENGDSDENSIELDHKPIEEVDPATKEDSNDAADVVTEDPLMKDMELQVEVDGDDELVSTLDVGDKPESLISLLSVKPPEELMQSNFVSLSDDENNLETIQTDVDPIETNDTTVQDDSEAMEEIDKLGEQYDNQVEFDEREAETILAEDDVTEVVSTTEQNQEETAVNKFVITLANRTENSICSTCKEDKVPEFLAHKDEECESLCSAACLETFKAQHQNLYIERILRLRVFAIPESTTPDVEQPLPVELEDEHEDRDPFRICNRCKQRIDVNNYITWEAQYYCDEGCLAATQKNMSNECAKCYHKVPAHIFGRYCVRFGMSIVQFCRTTCLISYKKAKKLCQFCQEDLKQQVIAQFCSTRCKETANSEMLKQKEIGLCSVCNSMKDVELVVRGDIKMDSLCSERCLVAYKFVNKIELVKCEVCPTMFQRKPGDATVFELDGEHGLCSKECQKLFLITHRKIVNCYMCLVKKYDFDMIRYVTNGTQYCVCSQNCLQIYFESSYSCMVKKFPPNIAHLETISKNQNYTYQGKSLMQIIEESHNIGKECVQTVIVTKPRAVPRQKNKAVMCAPRMLTKAIQHKIKEKHVDIQTDDTTTRWLPVPVPIFVPMPLHLYVQPVPMLTPIPIPLIIPIFILTGRRTMAGIQKEITKIKNRIPANPLEAELLMMADMAAGDKREPTSDSDEEVVTVPDPNKALTNTMQIDNASTSFSDDVLSMAFKMANEYAEPVDLEKEVDRSVDQSIKPRYYPPRARVNNQRMDVCKDDNYCLKYSFGISAWKQWASYKNIELQKQKFTKLIPMDFLQLSAEDLCACLCQFIREVKKPNGTPYACDTIYYLCLGIQFFLYENGRIDNLFCDRFYEKFTDTFNTLIMPFCQVYLRNKYVITRVEEEHLWESKQLGAHSPLVLLNTLLFFNTKHFNLTTVDDHLQLSFSHIMKHWKRNINAPNQRNVLLRFYPPSKGQWGPKRKVYEQQECVENPLRCPVRLYEFFLSKCPESVKTRNDVFYLKPERSCVPDSPVWYSTTAMDMQSLDKMLNRLKLIKEVSAAILRPEK